MNETVGKKKSSTKYILALLVLLALTVMSFAAGIENLVEYHNSMKNAVTVTATVGDTHREYREKVERYLDDTEVTTESYYTTDVTYTFRGREFSYRTTDYLGEKGTQIELVIDSTDPHHRIPEEEPGSGYFVFGGVSLSIFLIVLFFFIKSKYWRKK